MKRGWLTVVVVAAPIFVGAQQVVELDPAMRSRAGIVVRPVLDRTFGDQLRVVGEVVRSPGSTVEVKAIIPGRVETLAASPGEQVHAGEMVVELHSHELLAMQTDMLNAREEARLADSRAEAGRELFAIEGISRLEMENREQQARAARLRFENLRRELLDHGLSEQAVEKVLTSGQPDAHLPVAAPVDGVVLELRVQQHEWVREYDPLMVIGDPGQVEVELQLPPDQATSVSPGDVVEFIPVGRPDEAGRATVITRVPRVDPVTRTLAVRARITTRGNGLFPGAFIEGTLTHGTSRTAPSVPESAVIRVGGADVVFVEREVGVYESRPVELGQFNGSRYEVRHGVEVGEGVVVQGVFLLKSVLIGGEG